MTMVEMTELYDATVDDVWRTARGSGAEPDRAADVVTEAYVALWQLREDPEVVAQPRLWLMSRVYRAVRPEPVAA